MNLIEFIIDTLFRFVGLFRFIFPTVFPVRISQDVDNALTWFISILNFANKLLPIDTLWAAFILMLGFRILYFAFGFTIFVWKRIRG